MNSLRRLGAPMIYRRSSVSPTLRPFASNAEWPNSLDFFAISSCTLNALAGEYQDLQLRQLPPLAPAQSPVPVQCFLQPHTPSREECFAVPVDLTVSRLPWATPAVPPYV